MQVSRVKIRTWSSKRGRSMCNDPSGPISYGDTDQGRKRKKKRK